MDAGYAADMTVIVTMRGEVPERHHGYLLVPTRSFENGDFGAKDRSWNTKVKLVEL